MGRKLKESVSAGDLATALGLSLLGDPSMEIFSVNSVDESVPGSLCFAKDVSWLEKVSVMSVVISKSSDTPTRGQTILISEYPRLDFARALNALELNPGFVWSTDEPDIHPTVRIGSNVFLGKGVRIGAGTFIHHNVVIEDEVIIGCGCVIKSGAVIGENGFGFERDERGKALRLPHLGTVIVDDNVEIGSMTTVCRGTLSNTRLRNGCKVDDHVHIAHNVDVGADAFIIACAEISGGVKIGSGAWIAPNSCIINQVAVGVNAVVGLGAVVLKSVPDYSVVVGNPAKEIPK
jgi:UDP-3-O-[3-hydroxymyristoyl] glucosamine N-acyltransferase